MTLTWECDLYSTNMNQQAKYLYQRSLSSDSDYTRCTDCHTWTTKVVGKHENKHVSESYFAINGYDNLIIV